MRKHVSGSSFGFVTDEVILEDSKKVPFSPSKFSTELGKVFKQFWYHSWSSFDIAAIDSLMVRLDVGIVDIVLLCFEKKSFISLLYCGRGK